VLLRLAEGSWEPTRALNGWARVRRPAITQPLLAWIRQPAARHLGRGASTEIQAPSHFGSHSSFSLFIVVNGPWASTSHHDRGETDLPKMILFHVA
jgi:hypothetical protein